MMTVLLFSKLTRLESSSLAPVEVEHDLGRVEVDLAADHVRELIFGVDAPAVRDVRLGGAVDDACKTELKGSKPSDFCFSFWF